MVNKWGKYRKIFEIAKHENCSCNQLDKCCTGDDQYRAMRKAYIKTLNIIDKGNCINLRTQFNIFIILMTMYYIAYVYVLHIDSRTNVISFLGLGMGDRLRLGRHYLLHLWKTAFFNQQSGTKIVETVLKIT